MVTFPGYLLKEQTKEKKIKQIEYITSNLKKEKNNMLFNPKKTQIKWDKQKAQKKIVEITWNRTAI